MGYELWDMELEDLEHLLGKVAKGNTRDMSSFRDILLECYGGMNIAQYQKLEGFLRSELGLNSDAELHNMDNQQKLKVIEYLH